MDIEKILEEINKPRADLKAEVIAASLIQNGVDAENICVQNKGVFNRAFRKEIMKATIKENAAVDNIVEIDISRDGLYDLLPEGLFHLSLKGSSTSVANMVSEHKRYKEEEQKARVFFQPLENEFFFQKVNVEKIEKFFFQTIEKEKDKSLSSFWQLDESMPKKQKQKLIELLPQCKHICGVKTLMQKALSTIIDEDVLLEITEKETSFYIQEAAEHNNILGLDSMLGCQFEDKVLQYQFFIGPLKNANYEDYFPQKPLWKVLQFFYQCFTALEPEIITTFVTNKNQPISDNLYLGINMDL